MKIPIYSFRLTFLAFLVSLLFTFLPGTTLAQTTFEKLDGHCEEGGKTVSTAGQTSSSKTQASRPGCTVSVFLPNTTTPATICSDNVGPSCTPKPNPFTADTNTGYWSFFAAPGRYDLQFTGGTAPNNFVSPFSRTGIVVPSSQGTGAFTTGPGSSTDKAIARWNGTTGLLLQNSVVILGDAGSLTGLGTLNGHAIPSVSADTFTLLNASQTLTNKLITSATNVLGGVGMALGGDATGDMYFRSAGGFLTRLAIGSSGQALTVSGGLPAWATGIAPPFSDANPLIQNAADNTKKFRFDASSISPSTTRVITVPDANITVAGANFPNLWLSNIRQIFSPGANNAGINVGVQTTDPLSPLNGDLYYNTVANELRARINGIWVALGAGGGGGGGCPAGAAGTIQWNNGVCAGITGSSVNSFGEISLANAVRNTGTPNPALKVATSADTNMTAAVESIFGQFGTNAIRQWASGGTFTTQREWLFNNPTYAFTAAQTLTSAATVAIAGAPQAGTNATITNQYALWIQGGNTRLDGLLGIGVTGTPLALLHIQAASDAATIFAQGISTQTASLLDLRRASAQVFLVRGRGGVTITPALITTGSPDSVINLIGPAHTGISNVESRSLLFDLSNTVQFAGGGAAITTQRVFEIDAPLYTAAAAQTITTAATLALSGAPGAGTNMTITNAYTAWFQAGTVLFGNPSTSTGAIRFAVSGSANTQQIQGADVPASTEIFKWPSADPTAGQVLSAAAPSGGVVVLSWATGGGGGGNCTVAGTQGVYQINSGSSNCAAGVITQGTNGRLIAAPTAVTSGSTAYLTLTSPADTSLTASAESIGVNFNLSATRQFATGALTTQREFVVQAPTYGFVAASTLTSAATVAITGAPIAGTNATITNAYAFWVQGGNSRFDGSIGVNTSPGALVDVMAVSDINAGRFAGLSTGVSDIFEAKRGTTIVTTIASKGDILLTPVAATSGVLAHFRIVEPSDTTLTASTEAIGINYDLSATRQWATGNITTQREFVVQAPTYSFVAASTVTTAATLAVTGAPGAGTNATLTNSYAILVQGGTSFFQGDILVDSSLTLRKIGTLNSGAEMRFVSSDNNNYYSGQNSKESAIVSFWPINLVGNQQGTAFTLPTGASGNTSVKVSNTITSSRSLDVSGPSGQTADLVNFTLVSNATSAVANLATLATNSSGTPAAGFGSTMTWQLQSSTTTNRTAAVQSVYWNVATDASRGAVWSIDTVSNATQNTRLVVAPRKNLTNSAANNIFTLNIPTLTGASCTVTYEVFATDGTNVQVRSGIVRLAVIQKGGAFTTDILVISEGIAASAGTLTATFGLSGSGNTVTASVTPTSSLTTTTYYITYEVQNNSEQTITIL